MSAAIPQKPKLRMAVIGVGHLGRRHAEIYAAMPHVELVAVCDTDSERAAEIAQLLNCQTVNDAAALRGHIDAASLAIPTSHHADVGKRLLKEGIHLLIEKPICTQLGDASALIKLAAQNDLVLQVGHVERFNAAIAAALQKLSHPRFIEVHRLSAYPFRGTDVSVVLDVMIHDLDMILALVHSRAKRVEAVGLSVLSATEDISNARIVFDSGCVANLTASRISEEPIRRIRVFQEDSYLSIDYQKQTVELATKKGMAIERVQLPVNKRPPLQDELAHFVECVQTGQKPRVSGEDGKAALQLALRIEKAMRKSGNR